MMRAIWTTRVREDFKKKEKEKILQNGASLIFFWHFCRFLLLPLWLKKTIAHSMSCFQVEILKKTTASGWKYSLIVLAHLPVVLDASDSVAHITSRSRPAMHFVFVIETQMQISWIWWSTLILPSSSHSPVCDLLPPRHACIVNGNTCYTWCILISLSSSRCNMRPFTLYTYLIKVHLRHPILRSMMGYDPFLPSKHTSSSSFSQSLLGYHAFLPSIL